MVDMTVQVAQGYVHILIFFSYLYVGLMLVSLIVLTQVCMHWALCVHEFSLTCAVVVCFSRALLVMYVCIYALSFSLTCALCVSATPLRSCWA